MRHKIRAFGHVRGLVSIPASLLNQMKRTTNAASDSIEISECHRFAESSTPIFCIELKLRVYRPAHRVVVVHQHHPAPLVEGGAGVGKP